MRTHELTGHAVLEASDVAKCCYCAGVSAHNGVLVLWDSDYDQRVIELVDSITDDERAELVAAHEAKGCLSLFWRAWVPTRFQVAAVVVAGDYWTAFHSVGAGRQLQFNDGCLDLTLPAAAIGQVERAVMPDETERRSVASGAEVETPARPV